MDLLNAFQGRRAELILLADQLELAVHGEPGIVVISGETGSGKSSLLAAFARDIAWKQRGIRALLVRPPDTGRYDPVAQAARDLEGRLARSMGRAPGASRLLPDWVGTIPVIGNVLAAVIATVGALQRRRAEKTGISAEVRRILRAARTRTLVLSCDDIHRADAAALQQLEVLIHSAAPGRHLLVVATHHTQDRLRMNDLRGALLDANVAQLNLAPVPRAVDLSVHSPQLLVVLRAASAIGESFDSHTLARALQRDELDVEDVLAVAVRNGVTVIEGEVDVGEGECATQYRFTSVSVRSALRALDELPVTHNVAV